MDAWLKCQTKPGVFSGENMVGIETVRGRVHLFANDTSIRLNGTLAWLKVKVLPHSTFIDNGDGPCRRIMLPEEPIECSRCVIVKSVNLQLV